MPQDDKSEVYPNISWEKESQKLFTGSDFQKGAASTLRSVEAELQGMEAQLKAGVDPLALTARARVWLAQCLYSSNMENFKQSSQ